MSIKLKIASLLVAIVVVNNILIITPSFSGPYYAFLICSLLFCLIQSKICRIDLGMSFLYLVCVFSIIVNHIPDFFQSWERLISFLLVTFLISPFIGSDFLYRFRIKLFETIQWLMQPVILISFLAYFMGISYATGHFVGITTHSMLIAPISANVFIGAIYLLTRKYSSRFSWKLYYIILLICSFVTLLLAASRTAIIGLSISLIFYFYEVNKTHFLKFLGVIGMILLFLLVTYSFWNPYLDNLNRKNEYAMEQGSLTSSRDAHWKNRLWEFKNSPFVGIGFSAVSLNNPNGSTFSMSGGQVETGSSWLSVLSMTGIFGFVVLLYLFFRAGIDLLKLKRKHLHFISYLLSLLLFWIFHMMAEGYIFGAGGFLFFNVWLLLGTVDALTHGGFLSKN